MEQEGEKMMDDLVKSLRELCEMTALCDDYNTKRKLKPLNTARYMNRLMTRKRVQCEEGET